MRCSLRLLPSIKSRSKRRNRRTAGFSLVEMLVAVAIVGLLVGLVGPAAMRQLQASRVNATEAQISQLRAALDIYQIDTGRLPSEDQGLGALVSNASGDVPGWNGPYLRDGKLPQDAWGGAFLYRYDGDRVEVISLGADGQPGGTGQNADISG
ncbi:MAG: type II secretion system major pseudopilin GspG [Pseudomonadota bacterium]